MYKDIYKKWLESDNVNEKLKRKNITKIEMDIIQWEFGNLLVRKRILEALEYDYVEAQN